MTTSNDSYRAAYIPDDGTGCGGGIRLTNKDEQHLSDVYLLAIAESRLSDLEEHCGEISGDIEIGMWKD